ncbi:MAG: hypothetical protein JXJ30_02690 [Halothiobacillaceae bacterium]|nr:hypothetical protein [Halothiobacillaceae bacterium]HER35274.1 hypothetical protein [Halothiobacillaceae bacterium]
MRGWPFTASWVLFVLSAALAVARADIPLPDRDTDAQTGGLAKTVDLGPIEPLPPVDRVSSEAGAGRLPEGVTVTTEVTRLEPVQRETFLVTQTILDPARRLRDVEVHRPEGEGIDARPIVVTRDTVEIDGRLVERRRYRWAVQPLRGGDLRLDFHRINFEVVGSAQSEYAFVPVARRLAVTELPAYLPTYLPVTPELVFKAAEVGPLVAGEPGNWQFWIRGEGLSAAALTRLISAQLVAPPGLRLSEPAVHALPRSDEEAAIETSSLLTRTWQVDITLLPSTEAGADGRRRARLPALRIPYIDPRAASPGAALSYARLDAREVSWQAEAAVRWFERLKAALSWLFAGVVGLVALVVLGRLGRRRWHAWRARRAARQRLLACTDSLALRRQLLAELRALPQPVWPATAERLAARGAPPNWLAALASLESACFGGQTLSAAAFDAVRHTVVTELPRPWFR